MVVRMNRFGERDRRWVFIRALIDGDRGSRCFKGKIFPELATELE